MKHLNHPPSPEVIQQRIREKMQAIQVLESQLCKQEDDTETIENIINLCHELRNEVHKLGLAEALAQKLLRKLSNEALVESNHSAKSLATEY
jgi:ribosomal protein S25